MSPSFLRASLRYQLRQPLQLILCILGIAGGVALVFAIDIAIESTRRAFQLSTDSLRGRATHRIVGGSEGVPDEVYRRLRVDEGRRNMAPVLEADVVAIQPEGLGALRLFGIDPWAEGELRGEKRFGATGGGLLEPGRVLLQGLRAEEFGLKEGDRIAVAIGGRRVDVEILLSDDDDPGLAQVLFCDIATAQELCGSVGYISQIDLVLDEGEDLESWRRVLPPSCELVAASGRAATLDGMVSAFDLNLRSLSLLALVVGVFLIYNTMTFSVLRRRELFGRLRAIGATRREVFAVVLAEAALIGTLGVALGLGLGYLLGRGLIGIVAGTISNLYFQVSVTQTVVSATGLLIAFALGLLATLAAALLPAWEATRSAPSLTMMRSRIEDRARSRLLLRALAAILVGLAAWGLASVPSRSIYLGYSAMLLVILAFVLLTTPATLLIVSWVTPMLRSILGIPGALAARSVSANLSRTGVAIAALMVAVSMSVGVTAMIGSFRSNVIDWLESTLTADVYISMPGTAARRSSPSTIDAALVQEIVKMPGVDAVLGNRQIWIEGQEGELRLIAFSLPDRESFGFRMVEGDADEAFRRYQREEGLLVSEPFAFRRELKLNDDFVLRTDKGERSFKICGIFRDFASDVGYVSLSRGAFSQHYDDRGFSGLGLRCAEGVDPEKIVADILRSAEGRQRLLVRSTRRLQTTSIEIFDQTFVITRVLRWLAVGVAIVGVLGALLALTLERRRELALLRAQGLTPRGVFALVLGSCGLLGAIAGLLAAPLGAIFALILTQIVNRRSFGWTVQLELSPTLLVSSIGLALIAALLAGIWPAWSASRRSPALALKEE